MKKSAPLSLKKSTTAKPARGAVQGEGDYNAARRHRAAVERFVQSGQVDDAARAAEPKTPVEELELFEAERSGEARAKGEDPALHVPFARVARTRRRH